MKKLLLLLLLSTSLSTFADDHLESLPYGFCYESPKAQVRNGLFFLPNQTLPYSGENICVYPKNGQYHSQGEITDGKQEGWWTWWEENGERWKKEQYEDGEKTGYKKTNPTFNDYGQIESELILNRYGNEVGVTKYVYRDDNSLREEKSLGTNGKLNGTFIYYIDVGQKVFEDNYKDDKLHGKKTEWDWDDGWKEKEANYKDGTRHGKVTEWDKSGLKLWEGNFKDDVPDGKWTSWGTNALEETFKDGTGNFSIFKNYKLIYKLIYEDGEGIETRWSEKNGLIEEEITYKNGKKNGKSTTWWNYSDPHYLWIEDNYKDGKKNGKSTYWHENGRKESEGDYKNGKLDGKYTEWYENGQQMEEYNYKDGVPDGEWTSWFKNGLQSGEGSFKDGTGSFLQLHENNQKSFAVIYEDWTGTHTSWYENGQKDSEENYKNGKLDGKSTSWSKNGQIYFELNFKDGECISEDCYY